MIVVVANEKGGVGKTTLAANLAILRAQQDAKVLVVDADPQGSISEFFRVRTDEGHEPSLTCVAIAGRGVSSEVRKLVPNFSDVVIDVGGRDTAAFRSALLIADVLLVPFLPGQFDAWSLETVDALVDEAQALNQGMKALMVMNKTDTNPRVGLAGEVGEFAEELKNLTLLPVRVGYRVAYRRSAAEGQAVNEIGKKDSRATQEMRDLYKEVFTA